MALLRNLQRLTTALENGLLTLTLSSMVLLALTQILLRNFWHMGIGWADPTLRVLVLWVALLGGLAATRDNNHIRIDIVSRYLSPAWRRHAARASDLFSALICALIAWHSARFVMQEYADGIVLFASVPAWLCESILPAGFALMAIRFLLSAVAGSVPELPR
jgi:TRAP-type C4-dicarboxylate transport system permease small subunit